MNPFPSPLPELQALQTTSLVFMVRPVAFAFNEQTAESNAFQHSESQESQATIQQRAQHEFDVFVDLLRTKGIEVVVFEDHLTPHTPDSIFHNNWISFHTNGKVILYPILAHNRRLERRWDIVDHFKALYPCPEVIDFSHYENTDQFLEGTGSMIIDRVNQRVYACISPRTDPEMFQRFCTEMDCQGILFHARDGQGQDIYHTNVMMALGTDLAVICLDSLANDAERNAVVNSLQETGHQILDISLEQVHQFAGNMLQLHNPAGENFWVLSQRAFNSLRPEQLTQLSASGTPLPIPVEVIETYGGGSVRCMIAEVFPPRA
ncbi:MAG: arginine deiminase-related protein [Bacteroidota bacterium]